MRTSAVIIALGVLLLASSVASAGTVISDYWVQENSSTQDLSLSNLKLSLTVDLDDSNDELHLTIANNSTYAGTSTGIITKIWLEKGINSWMDNTVDPVLTPSSGVDFAVGDPLYKDPVGKNALSWIGTDPWFDRTSTTDTDNGLAGGVANGINEDEYLKITFSSTETSESDIVKAILSGDARIAMHIQSLPYGASIGVVFTPNVIPLPSGAWMGLALLGSLGIAQIVRRRRRLSAI